MSLRVALSSAGKDKWWTQISAGAGYRFSAYRASTHDGLGMACEFRRFLTTRHRYQRSAHTTKDQGAPPKGRTGVRQDPPQRSRRHRASARRGRVPMRPASSLLRPMTHFRIFAMNLISISCVGSARRGVTRMVLATAGLCDPYASLRTGPAAAERLVHIGDVDDFLHDVIQRGAECAEDLLRVLVCLTIRRFQVRVIADRARIVE